MATNLSDNYLNDEKEEDDIQWNHDRADLKRLDGNTLHNKTLIPFCRVMTYR